MSDMLRIFLHIKVFYVACMIGSAAALAGASIGVIDVFRILNDSEAAQHIQVQREAIRSDFLAEISNTEQALRAEEKALLENKAKLSQEDYLEKRRAYESKLLKTRKDAQQKKRRLEEASNNAVNRLRDELYRVAQEIANERGFELVISNKNVIAGETSLDITDDTMQKLNASLPEIALELKE